jgi:hypothetical protein
MALSQITYKANLELDYIIEMGSSRRSKWTYHSTTLEFGCKRYEWNNLLWDVGVIMTSASHRCMTSARERTGGRHVAGSEWPPDARAPQPRAGGERLGGPRGTPQVATSSPAVGPRLQAHARESAHGKAATRCRRVGAGQRKARPRGTAQERTAGPATWRSQIGWLWFSDPDSGFAPFHATQTPVLLRIMHLESGSRPVLCSTNLGRRALHCSHANRPWGGRFGP